MDDEDPQLKFTISAPGKIILLGEHTAVYGKTAIAASLGLRTTLAFQTKMQTLDKNMIELDLPFIEFHHIYSIRKLTNSLLMKPLPLKSGIRQNMYNLEKPELIDDYKLLHQIRKFLSKLSGHTPLSFLQETMLLALFCLLAGMFSCVPLPLRRFKIVVISSLPIGPILGGASSYAICVAAAMIHYIRSSISLLPEDQKDMSKKGYKSLKFWCTNLNSFDGRERDMISRWAYMTGRIMQGTASEIDYIICTYGSILQFKKGKEDKKPDIELIPHPKSLKVLLIYTGISRETSKMVTQVESLRERYLLMVDHIISAIDEVSRSAACILKTLSQAISVIEDANVKHELKKLGELIDMNQALLQALGVSNPAMDSICHIVQKLGLHVTMTGDGGYCFAYMLIAPNSRKTHIEMIKAKLNRKQFRYVEVQLGGPGVRLLNKLERETTHEDLSKECTSIFTSKSEEEHDDTQEVNY